MPKSHSMESIQADLEQYARDEFPQTQGRGLVTALSKHLDVPYSTIQRAFSGDLVSASMARRVRSKIASTRTVGWPQEPGAVLKKYLALQQAMDPDAFNGALEVMDLMAHALLKQADANAAGGVPIEVPFWHYMRGYIATDRAAHLLRQMQVSDDLYAREDDRCKQEQASLNHYRTAHTLLSAACDSDQGHKVRYGRYLDKLRFSMFAVHFNIHQPGKRASSEVLMAELRQGEYLSLINVLSHAEPKSRGIQQAGLILASVLGESEQGPLRSTYARSCEVFFARLCLADERFNDLEFQPADFTHSLAQDPDLAFFRALPSIRAKLAPHELARSL